MAQYYIPLVATPQIGGSGGGSSGGGVLVVNVTEGGVCDKTAGEIYAACPGVMFVRDVGVGSKTVEYISGWAGGESGYEFVTYQFNQAPIGPQMFEYTAASADEYPMYAD